MFYIILLNVSMSKNVIIVSYPIIILHARRRLSLLNHLDTSYQINLLFYISYHDLKFMLPSISWGHIWVKSNLFPTWDLLFYICIWIFTRFLHSSDVQQDRFHMLLNPSSFALSLLPEHLMQHNESVTDTLRWSLCQCQWDRSMKGS